MVSVCCDPLSVVENLKFTLLFVSLIDSSVHLQCLSSTPSRLLGKDADAVS